ncbi:MAG: DUF3097 domain-containing protein [Actinomycetota bacterium]|nr:DUF3097 domain-containing protein [Actinomycetota bacterium]
MKSKNYGPDVLADLRRPRALPPEVRAEHGEVVEDAVSGFTGEIVEVDQDTVTLLGRRDVRRVFPLLRGAFLIDGKRVTLVQPVAAPPAATRRTASGSIAAPPTRARVARASRIYVEGRHDAELVERVWGADLRGVGVVVEALDGIDDLGSLVTDFGPAVGRRLGVLVDHLVPGSKESRIVATVRNPYVMIVGHPYVDIWQAVKPSALGIAAWPVVPRGQDWKQGVCDALGVADPPAMWRRILASVDSYTDLETTLLGAVERLIDFVTVDPD